MARCCNVWAGFLNEETIELFGIVTDLIIGNGVSNIIHEFGHDLNILVVFRACHIFDASQYFPKLALDPIEGARKHSVRGRLGKGGITDMNKSARRIDSCASTRSSLFSPKPNLSNRARAVSIFLFVVGDFFLRVRWVLRWVRVIIPRAASRPSQRKTCGIGRFVNGGAEHIVDEQPYS